MGQSPSRQNPGTSIGEVDTERALTVIGLGIAITNGFFTKFFNEDKINGY
jgi:hypothetical protein